MPCFRPLTGYRAFTPNAATGKRSIVFHRKEGLPGSDLTLPCGQCRHCRLEHSRQWAMRAVHEASLWDRNCFLTLTYSDEHLPSNGSLDYDAPVLFMKRLRERYGNGIRSYGCAEYGELLGRPHYHLCIFNFDFPDKDIFKAGDFPLYRSPSLEELWTFGHSSIGELTFESAAYVARYVTKKITGDRAESHYGDRLPERSICVSRRPGLGRGWYDQFGKRVRDHDEVVLRGRKVRPAKYYDYLFDRADPTAFAAVKERRKESGERAAAVLNAEHAAAMKISWQRVVAGGYAKLEPVPEHRMSVLERAQELKFKELRRGFENA